MNGLAPKLRLQGNTSVDMPTMMTLTITPMTEPDIPRNERTDEVTMTTTRTRPDTAILHIMRDDETTDILRNAMIDDDMMTTMTSPAIRNTPLSSAKQRDTTDRLMLILCYDRQMGVPSCVG